jgi:hypothetical protein
LVVREKETKEDKNRIPKLKTSARFIKSGLSSTLSKQIPITIVILCHFKKKCQAVFEKKIGEWGMGK